MVILLVANDLEYWLKCFFFPLIVNTNQLLNFDLRSVILQQMLSHDK